MRIGPQTTFAEPVGVETLREVKRRGFDMARIDANWPQPPFAAVADPAALAQEAIDADLQPLVIIRDPDQQVPQLQKGIDVELGNEPIDPQFGWTRASYRAAVDRFIVAIENRNSGWIGSINNLSDDAFRFLESLPWKSIPREIGCAVHRYPVAGKHPEVSHLRGGFGKRLHRDEEIKRLRDIVGDRPLGISECGFHQLDYTEERAAEYAAWERAFYLRHHFDFVSVYQLNSGPPESREFGGHFGLRRFDLTWKDAIVAAWTGVAA